MKKYRKWLVSMTCVILFLIIGLYLINLNDNLVDKSIYNAIISLKSNTLTIFFKIITELAGVKFMILISVIILLLKKLKYIRYFIIFEVKNEKNI